MNKLAEKSLLLTVVFDSLDQMLVECTSLDACSSSISQRLVRRVGRVEHRTLVRWECSIFVPGKCLGEPRLHLEDHRFCIPCIVGDLVKGDCSLLDSVLRAEHPSSEPCA